MHITPKLKRKIERLHGAFKNKLRYNILDCVEGDMSFIFYTITNESNEINDYANTYIQIIYSEKLLP